MKKILADNLNRRTIFMDGEFTKLSPFGTRFVSIAFIADNGNELYVEIEHTEEVDGWVAENVIPYLTDKKVTEEEATEMIATFVKENYGDEKPVFISDVNQFDWMGICGLFGVWNVPFFYIPIDFVSILMQNKIDIDMNRFELAKQLGVNIEGFKQHNALCDCKVLKETYEKLTNYKK